MPIRQLLLICLAVLFMCAGCRKGPAAEADLIREFDRRWQTAMAAKDVATIIDLYAPQAIQMPANAPRIEGRDAIREWMTAWLLTPNSTASFEVEEIEVAESGDIAYDRGSYKFVTETPQGRTEDVGKYLTIWKKIGGNWRVYIDTDNSDRPCAGS